MIDQSKKITQFLLANIPKHFNDIVAITAEHFHVTRTTIHRHLTKLITQGKVVKAGTTRDVHYYLSSELNRSHSYKIQPNLSEYMVYKHDFAPTLSNLKSNIRDILNYAFTEIFNNAIDHSYGTKINASITAEKNDLVLTIQDNGIGVFKSLDNYFSLDDLREGVLQLNKGKMTTDPSNHSGEGIFFTSRIMDSFEISANHLHYIRSNTESDWGLETIPGKMIGLTVTMRLSKNSSRELLSIFNTYQDTDSLSFNKTDIIVEMAKWGDETLISRSQAKRILKGLEKFKHVTLDFKGIRLIGQGFVDEIFRVFINKFPVTEITYVNANDDIQFMIHRSLGTAR